MPETARERPHAGELFERLGAAMAQAGGSSSARLAVGLDAFFGFVEEHRVAAPDRVAAQVTELVAVLIAADPRSRVPGADEAEREQRIDMLAQALVGSVRSLTDWWADHREVPRERVVAMAMDFAWLGLERLSHGERWQRA